MRRSAKKAIPAIPNVIKTMPAGSGMGVGVGVGVGATGAIVVV